MKWKILTISIPVKNLQKSKTFYELILGKQNFNETSSQLIFGSNEDIFFGVESFGIRLFKPKQDLLIKNLQCFDNPFLP